MSTSRRRAVAVVALVVAVAAAWVLLGGGDDPPGAAPVRVVQVVADVPRGTPAEQALADGFLEVVEVPAEDPRALGAVDPAQLTGTVATGTLPVGALVIPGMFDSLPAGGSALGGRLPTPGHTALAITVDATRAVGGWVQPGDRVNLLVPRQCADEVAAQASAALTGGEVRCRRARYLYQAVDVLAVGTALGGTVGDPPAGGGAGGPLTIVLSLPPRAAQWVATWENELTLSLVPVDYQPWVVDPLPVVVDRLPGERDVTLRPGCVDPDAPGPLGEGEPCPPEAAP